MQHNPLRDHRRRGGRGWILAFALGILSLLIMLLIHVWTNIERVDTSYFITRAQQEIADRHEHLAKLEIERERLLTPHELKQKAVGYGMHEAYPGQIRRLDK
ncbi:MAG: hypothetical protein K6G15_07595 [Desulfovibrio sp.]|nr:hypothetical protein [Desulfovibrio sp.]